MKKCYGFLRIAICSFFATMLFSCTGIDLGNLDDPSIYIDQSLVTPIGYAKQDAKKDDVFKEKLGRISIKELARTAKDRRSGSLGFAEAILIYYNKKSRNPLTWDKLYTHKLPHKKDMEEEPSDIPEPVDADGESSQMELFGLHDSGVSG